MMDKNTFGDSPVEIYLANRLNELGSKKFTRKISSRVHEVQTMLSEIIEAHNMSAISTKTFSYMVFALEMKIDNSAKALMAELEYENSNVPDKLAVDLMLNVVKGGLKADIEKSIQMY